MGNQYHPELIDESVFIAPGAVVLGVLGRVVRQLTGEEVQSIRVTAEHYVEYGAMYKQGN